MSSDVNENQSKGILNDLQDEKKIRTKQKVSEKRDFISFWRNIFFSDFRGWMKKVPFGKVCVIKFDTLSLPSYHYAYKHLCACVCVCVGVRIYLSKLLWFVVCVCKRERVCVFDLSAGGPFFGLHCWRVLKEH